MSRNFWWLALALMSAVTQFGWPQQMSLQGSGSMQGGTTVMNGAAPATIPATYFGYHESHPDTDTFPPNSLLVPGPLTARVWNVSWSGNTLQWPGVNTCPYSDSTCALNPAKATFNWTYVDEFLATLKGSGYTDVLYTLSRTPTWASQAGNRCTGPGTPDSTCTQAPDTSCDYTTGAPQAGPGSCETNIDLNADGTGTDLTWRLWVYNLVKHVADPVYRQSHAHVGAYEIWNEINRNGTLYSGTTACGNGISCAWNGTYAQLLRMTQDARCIIEGIPSQPITALGKTCATDGSLPAIGLDPSARILNPSGGSGNSSNIDVIPNFLYCGFSGEPAKFQPPSNSYCNYGSAGSAAVDILNVHVYYTGESTPEQGAAGVATLLSTLNASDIAKPFWVSEGSWGGNTFDEDIEEATVPRWYLLLRDQGVDRGYWFGWDLDGILWEQNGTNGCNDGGSGLGCLTEAGSAYESTEQWLTGKSLTSHCASSNNIYQCSLGSSEAGYAGLVVWNLAACTNSTNGCDSTQGPQNCTYSSDCSSVSFTLPPSPTGVWSTWRDLDTNTLHSITGGKVQVGIKPILVETASGN